MSSDKEIAEGSLGMQERGKDVCLINIPGFKEWSERKSASGGSEDAIDSMFSQCMYLLPEEVSAIGDDDFNEIYEEIIEGFE